MRLCATILALSLVYPVGLLIAEEQRTDAREFDVADGVIATPDGRPGPILARQMQGHEDDLSDIAVRNVDVIYGRTYGTALTLDVYSPREEQNGAGIVYVVSGGLWSGPEYRRMPNAMEAIRAFVAKGYTVFAVIHSSQPKFTLQEIRHDVPRAIRYIRSRAKDFEIGSNRIGLIGFSSGGHLALLAATTAEDGRSGTGPVDAVTALC